MPSRSIMTGGDAVYVCIYVTEPMMISFGLYLCQGTVPVQPKK